MHFHLWPWPAFMSLSREEETKRKENAIPENRKNTKRSQVRSMGKVYCKQKSKG